MNLQGVRFWKGLQSDHLLTVLRVALGVIFVIGGLKLILPTLFGIPDHEALATSFTDPVKGWISPFFAEKVTEMLGIRISLFLYVQGFIEVFLGVLMILGVFTPMVAVNIGLMFWAFTVASPGIGQIRLSRDLALMGFSFAIALAGAGLWSIDGKLRRLPSMFRERKDLVLVIIRLSLAYPLVASALFSGGVLDNHLNTTIHVALVLLMGISLVAGVIPRWVMLLIILWMLYVLPENLFAKGFFSGLDSIKREIGLLAASLVYFISGPDRWAWPKPQRLLCRNVVDLILNYLEGALDRRERQAFEAHIADCVKCWRFLNSYQHTVDLGQTLREEDIPADVRRRLETFLHNRLQRSS